MSLLLALLLQVAYPPAEEQFPGAASLPGGSFPGGAPPAAASVYDDAAAIWTFNEINLLGAEGNDAFVSAAAYFTAASAQYAETSGNWSLPQHTSFTWASWVRPAVTNNFYGIAGQDSLAGATRIWSLYQSNTGVMNFFSVDSGGAAKTATYPLCMTAGTRTLVTAVYDQSTKQGRIYCDTGQGSLFAAHTSGQRAGTGYPFYLAARKAVPSGIPWDGAIGTSYYWEGKALSQAEVTSLYASGRGYTCAELPSALQTSLASCYEMTEDGGPYADSVGSETLTGVSTPTQVTPGLVLEGTGDPDLYLTEVNVPTEMGGALGYAADHTAGTDYSTLADSAAISGSSASQGWCAWFIPQAQGNIVLIGKDDGATEREFQLGTTDVLDRTTNHYWDSTGANTNVTVSGYTQNQRHLNCSWWDSSDGKVYGQRDGETPLASAGTITNVKDGTDPLNVNGVSPGTGNANVVSPIFRYKGSIPPADSIWNSGKGVQCADAPQTNLVACWKWIGGIFEDQIGALDMTAVNTSTVAGLVERSDSGMGIRVNDTDGSYFLSKPDWNGLNENSALGVTFAYWFNEYNSDATNGLMTQTWSGVVQNIGISVFAADNTQFSYKGANGVTTVATAGNGAYAENEWNLIFAWWDPADGFACLQVNADAVRCDTTDPSTAISGGTPNADFRISNGSVDANIDNWAIWYRVLTADERADLWAAGAGLFYPEEIP